MDHSSPENVDCHCHTQLWVMSLCCSERCCLVLKLHHCEWQILWQAWKIIMRVLTAGKSSRWHVFWSMMSSKAACFYIHLQVHISIYTSACPPIHFYIWLTLINPCLHVNIHKIRPSIQAVSCSPLGEAQLSPAALRHVLMVSLNYIAFSSSPEMHTHTYSHIKHCIKLHVYEQGWPKQCLCHVSVLLSYYLNPISLFRYLDFHLCCSFSSMSL